MGEITLTTFLLKEVLRELRSLLVVLVLLAVLVFWWGNKGGLVGFWCFALCSAILNHKITILFQVFLLDCFCIYICLEILWAPRKIAVALDRGSV